MTQTTTQAIAEDQRKSFEDFTQHLCDMAAETSLAYFRKNPDIENKATDQTRFDPVTIADQNIEKLIITEIAKAYPDHTIIGEETGTQKSSSDYSWVIDPIDGTGAYISGIPVWGTLIGLLKGGNPVLGMMDQPFLKERYIGSTAGAFLIKDETQKALATSSCKRVDEARLATTSPELFGAEEREKFEAVKQASKIIRYGTDCSAYGLLAAGHIDLVIESGLNTYDICALIPVIEAAGGVITTWQGGSAARGGQVIAAATPALHLEACALLT